MDVSLEIDDGVTQEMNRLLCTTRVMNIYAEPICVLQHLCGAFQLMSKAHLHHTANLLMTAPWQLRQMLGKCRSGSA